MIAHELTGIVWRKSSYSGHEACVEVAAAGGDVLVSPDMIEFTHRTRVCAAQDAGR